MPCTDFRSPSKPRSLTVVDWSRDLDRWIVSAQMGDDWTLVGIFESADEAFRAAERASDTFGGSDT